MTAHTNDYRSEVSGVNRDYKTKKPPHVYGEALGRNFLEVETSRRRDQTAMRLAEEREGDLWLLVRLRQDRDACLLDDLVTRELSGLRGEVRVEDAAP